MVTFLLISHWIHVSWHWTDVCSQVEVLSFNQNRQTDRTERERTLYFRCSAYVCLCCTLLAFPDKEGQTGEAPPSLQPLLSVVQREGYTCRWQLHIWNLSSGHRDIADLVSHLLTFSHTHTHIPSLPLCISQDYCLWSDHIFLTHDKCSGRITWKRTDIFKDE